MVNSCVPCVHANQAAATAAAAVSDPLIMGNGQELVAMCCMSYESPDAGETVVNSDGEEDEERGGYDYCEYA